MLEVYRSSSVEWKPSPVVALATSVDDSQVAAARDDGSLEIWLVSPGSVGWHCQLTIHGNSNSRVSSLAWCLSGSSPSGRLFSSSIDGSVSEWDLFDLKQKIALDTIGVSIWQMAVATSISSLFRTKDEPLHTENGHPNDKLDDDDDRETSESKDDSNLVDLHEQPIIENTHVALACDDGCVRIYSISGSEKLTYVKSLTRVSGRVLSVTWSPDGNLLYSGSSDGFIRCWDAKLAHEIYRITVGLGGSGSGPNLCIWSLLGLRCGTLVSADSTGSVQFWDGQHGTLLQAHSCHKGDANTLAAVPSHNRVFSAGSDGQVVDVGSAELVHTFTPHRKEHDEQLPPSEPPITKMFSSSDGQWLAAINCFGDIYVFNLEIQRQHWFISRLDGASVTAGGFSPRNSNLLIISTSSNQVYAFDVEAKQLGEWSMQHTFVLPRRYQEFPGEVIGLSFPPSSNSSSVIIYSSRAMCLIDFGLPVDRDDDNDLINGHDPALKKLQNSSINGRLKWKLKGGYELDTKHNGRKNFEFCAFRDSVLFVGHLSKKSVLIMDKPWMEVVKTFDAPPVHRHIFGT